MEALVSQYVTGELALLVACLMIIGKVLKTYKYLDNKWIPLVLLPISIVIVFGIKVLITLISLSQFYVGVYP